jgi:hypothetical protein
MVRHPGSLILKQGLRLCCQKGIALATVLVLTAISLSIVASLVYLVTQGTRFSGFHKRYATAHEAGTGGAELIMMLIHYHGDIKTGDFAGLNLTTMSGAFGSCDCGDPLVFNDTTPSSCLCRKLCDPTDIWVAAGCSNSYINPSDIETSFPDLRLDLTGTGGTTYRVFTKIVDTTIGNTDLSGLNLGGTGVVNSSGTISAPTSPYLYSIEILSEDSVHAIEQSRLSVLYAY